MSCDLAYVGLKVDMFGRFRFGIVHRYSSMHLCHVKNVTLAKVKQFYNQHTLTHTWRTRARPGYELAILFEFASFTRTLTKLSTPPMNEYGNVELKGIAAFVHVHTEMWPQYFDFEIRKYTPNIKCKFNRYELLILTKRNNKNLVHRRLLTLLL